MRGMLQKEVLYHQTRKGLKTQTRRSGGLDSVNYIKVPIPSKGKKQKYKLIYCADQYQKSFHVSTEEVANNGTGTFTQLFKHVSGEVSCEARYKFGEILYLKEPYLPDSNDEYMYAYSKAPAVRQILKWKNKLFMPAKAGREFIKITGIRCERLLDICDDDCIAEGIEFDRYTGWLNYMHSKTDKTFAYGSPKNSFLSLFRFANGISAKKEIENIWVFVYEYEYLKDYKPPA